jgi:excisionase family DNA binding protein
MIELPNKAYFRPKEVAEYFSVSERTVYSWIDQGIIEARKLGQKSVRIPFFAVEKFGESTLAR